MADPLSVTAGVIQVAGFALGGVKVLYDTIQSLKNSSKIIGSISEELEALSGILQSLDTAVDDPDTEFASLKVPLQRCGVVCRDFQKLMSKIDPGNDKGRQKFQGWFRLQTNGQDIRSFKESLDIWKSTISIALGDANLRNLIVTSQVLKEYKQMIAGTSNRAEMRLEILDETLESLPPRQDGSSEGAAERGPLQQERDSTRVCLDICTEVMVHVANAQHNVFENISTPDDATQRPVTTLIGLISSREATSDALRACETTLSRASSRLQRQLQDVDDLQALPSGSNGSASDIESTRGNLEAEVESTKSAISVLSRASETANGDRVNVFEDVTMAEDGNQYIVSTIGDLISAKRVSAGARSAQVMGQLSEANFDRAIKTLTQHGGAGRGSDAQPGASGAAFDGRYGAGRRVNARGEFTGVGSVRPKGN